MHEYKKKSCEVDDDWIEVVDSTEVGGDGSEGIDEDAHHHLS